MGGRRRKINGIYIICDNNRKGLNFIAETVAEAKRLTGVSYEHINALIKSGKQTKDGWTFDETFGYGDEDETE